MHKSKIIKIPAPKFVVFYNGESPLADKTIYKLSDHFEKELIPPELELIVTVFNINENRNPEIMNACRTLRDYSIFVGKIRKYVKEMDVANAVTRAIEECIRENVLADFLKKNRAEVFNMSVLEYNEELHLKNVHQEGYDEGHDEGYDEGYDEGHDAGFNEGKAEIDELYSWLKSSNRTDDILLAIGNKAMQNRLLEEYRKIKANQKQ